MKLSIEATADEIQKVLQAIDGGEEHFSSDNLVTKFENYFDRPSEIDAEKVPQRHPKPLDQVPFKTIGKRGKRALGFSQGQLGDTDIRFKIIGVLIWGITLGIAISRIS